MEHTRKKFTKDWHRRMRFFDSLVSSVLGYGTEIWGWKEWEELEKIQDRYMKWRMKLDRTTPRHILHEEARRFKLANWTGSRRKKKALYGTNAGGSQKGRR